MVLRSLRLDLMTGPLTREIPLPSTKHEEGSNDMGAAEKAGPSLLEIGSAVGCFTRACLTRIPRSS